MTSSAHALRNRWREARDGFAGGSQVTTVIGDKPGHLMWLRVLEAQIAELDVDERLEAVEVTFLVVADALAPDLGANDQASGLLGDDQRSTRPVDGRTRHLVVLDAPEAALRIQPGDAVIGIDKPVDVAHRAVELVCQRSGHGVTNASRRAP